LTSDVKKATRYKAKARHCKAKALDGKAKAKDSGFKVKANKLASRPRPNITDWSGNL